MMRYFIFDKFNTWYDWRLTLSGKSIPDPEPKTNYINIDGADGSLDMSEVLTGKVTYSDRTVTASFRTSEGTHEERMRLLRQIKAALHGRKVKIIEPDDPQHYFFGRVKIKDPTADQVHLAFTVEATCEPWRYAVNETERIVQLSSDGVTMILRNEGTKTLCPTIKIDGTVSITANGVATELSNGTYKITDIQLAPGINAVGLTGAGTVTFIYREAEL